MAGLMYARNRLVHQPARIGEFVETPGAIGGAAIATMALGGGGAVSWTWKRLDELPEPELEEREGRDDAYCATVANQALLVPLYSARDFLFRLRHQP